MHFVRFIQINSFNLMSKGERDTKLTAWFNLNREEPEARIIKYLDIAK